MSIYYYGFLILFLEYSFFEVTHQQCPCTSKQTTKFQLLVCNCPRTWSEADVECRSKGATLARIDNKTDDSTVSTELSKLNVGQAWIGGKIDAGDWRWIHDKTPMYGQGCYSYPTNTGMFTHTETSQQMSVSGCVSTCKQRGQPYAGVYKGDTCLCMMSYNSTTFSSGCTVKCQGNWNERCGGSNVFYVYATSAPVVGQWQLDYPSNNYPDHMCVKVTCQYLPMPTWKLQTSNCKARYQYLCIYKKDGLCPTGSQQIGTLCYTRSSTAATWYDANLNCAQNGGVLADITSPDVYNTLVTSARSIQCYDGSVWLGASKSLLSWTTGQTISFTNWASVFPSRLSFTTRCLYLTNQFNQQYQWADEICDLNKAFVCMKGSALTTTTTIRPTTTTTTSTTTSTTTPRTTTTTTTPSTTTTISTTRSPTTTRTTNTRSPTTTSSTRLPITSSTTTTSSTTRTSTKTSTTPKITTTTRNRPNPNPITTQSSTPKSTKSTTAPSTTSTSGSVTTSSPSTSSSSGSVVIKTTSTTTQHPANINKTMSAKSTTVSAVSTKSTMVSAVSKQVNVTVGISTPVSNKTDPGAGLIPEMTTGWMPEPEPKLFSSEDVGGIVLIIVAVIILSIFFVMSVLCCMRPCLRSYFKSKKQKKAMMTGLTNTNPRRAFVRDTDFAYLDVSQDKSSLTKGKSSQPVYDKEKSLQRYHSLDIDKGLKKDEMGPRVNMNYLNNQTQTGNSLNAPDISPQYNIPAQTKSQLDYIDNVGAFPAKDSNLQQNKVHFTPKQEEKPVESTNNQLSIEVHNPVANRAPQKTVIQVTGEKDIIEEPNIEQSNDFENDEGYINDDAFIDADYEDPRDHTFA